MQYDHAIGYLNTVESAFKKLRSGYFERYEEEILTPERVNIRIRVRFPHVYLLEWNEAVIAVKGQINHLSYRYQSRLLNGKIRKWIIRMGNMKFLMTIRSLLMAIR